MLTLKGEIMTYTKENLDNSISTLDNIQIQMDKKVEEAKKYKSSNSFGGISTDFPM